MQLLHYLSGEIMERSVIITGASSGIGRSLAFEFSNHGFNLGLLARRKENLELIKQKIEKQSHAKVVIDQLDVNQTTEIPDKLSSMFYQLGPVNSVIVNAGINDFSPSGRNQFHKQHSIIQTNLLGAMATVDSAINLFKTQGFGQIVGISSLAAISGIPQQSAYCASKAGFCAYLDSIRKELHNRDISITQILPGFINTDIMDNMSQYPFTISSEKAAKLMYKDILSKKKSSVIPRFPWIFMKPILPLIPDRVHWKMSQVLSSKQLPRSTKQH